MSLLDFFRPNSKKNIERRTTLRTLQHLRSYGVTENKEKKLEFFFYTDTEDRAKALGEELVKLQYSVSCSPAADSSGKFVITGWTTPIQMSEKVVIAWAKRMHDLGNTFKSEFDGWGTNVDKA